MIRCDSEAHGTPQHELGDDTSGEVLSMRRLQDLQQAGELVSPHRKSR